MPEDLTLSATEAGLLTVAERRGQVATARAVGRDDPTSVERKEILDRLSHRGLLQETEGPPEEIVYAITDRGRAAIAALDAKRAD